MHQRFRISYNATIRSRSKNAIRVWLARPTSDHVQTVHRFTTSFAPTGTLTAQETTLLTSPVLRGPVTRIVCVIEATLKTRMAPQHVRYPRAPARRYLQIEPSLEQPQWLIQQADAWQRESADRSDQLWRAFKFVAHEVAYRFPVRQRGVRFLLPNKLEGDCGESAGLLVAFARQLRVAARPEVGYVVSTEGNVVEHAWASVRASGAWHDLDPQFASLEPNARGMRRYFLRRSDLRLVLARGYNFPLQPPVAPGFRLATLHMERTPMTRTSVQTLQPLAIASRAPITVAQAVCAELLPD